MSRICVPGLLTLLVAAPLTAFGDDKAEAQPSAALKEAAEKAAADGQAAAAKAAAQPEPAKEAPDAEKKKEAAPAPAAAAAPAPAAVQKLNLALLHPLLRARVLAPAQAAAPLVAAAKAAGDDKEKDDDDDAAIPELTGEDKKALDEFLQKASKAKRKQFEDSMTSIAEALAKEVKLDDAAAKKLASFTTKAVDTIMPDWEKGFRTWINSMVPRVGAARILANWAPANYIRNTTGVTGFSPPEESDTWKQAVKEVLTPEQLTAYLNSAKSAEKKFQEDYGDYLATCEGQAGDAMSASIEAEITRIVQFSGIDEARRKKLKEAGDEAVKLCVKEWRAKTEKQLRAMDQKERDQMTSRGGIMTVNLQEKAAQPKERAVWKDAVAQILKDQERETLKTRTNEVRGRRASALAIVLINDLDRLVGFSIEQRDQFLPLAAKRMMKLPDTYFSNPDNNNGYYAIDTSVMLQQVQKLKDDEVKSVLSPSQLQRFRGASSDQMSRPNVSMQKIEIEDLPKPEEMDEVEVERLLARFLHSESKKMKLRMFSMMEAQVEHVSRVTSPAPETIVILTTAAKGAAEEMSFNTVNNLSAWLRNTFQTIKPADVPGRLQNLYNPYASDRTQPPIPSLWTNALKRLLTPEQRALWKKETDVREVWRREGVTAVVVSDVEKRIVLSDDQRTKLTKKIDTVISEYESDFSNYLSNGWHLQSYYSLIPIAMFSEKEMQEYFDKDQIETLKDKALGNAMQYAEMIRQQHGNRLRIR